MMQDGSKNVTYVQITAEMYAHLTELEDQVKSLNEKLSSAQAEMTTKDNHVKQHAKVAEEAVSGWEKAEAEALALKHQLESVTLLRLTAEDRAAHLDGALKECMRQIRNVKEEDNFEQELLKASAENEAISRSLQERSTVLMKISEEKAQADAEIEVLRANNHSYEREISSLKYELHIVSKELEIRSEEKNMSIRSAEVANKQYLESVKKITKLEAECQRLRGLVRKKLPGPAALAQMKLEVDILGQDYGEPRLRRSSTRSPSPHQAAPPEYSSDNFAQSHKEAEFFRSRLLVMEEETKMLKEALSKRNSELQSSRNLCAKTASRLRSVEAQMLVFTQQKSPRKAHVEIPSESFISQNESNPPSLTSMSEDGVDEEGSCADSWATAMISELSYIKKEKNSHRSDKAENASRLELMDDFLEMEKLACMSTESNGTAAVPDKLMDKRDESAETRVPMGSNIGVVQHSDFHPPVSSDDKSTTNSNQVYLSKLQSKIAVIFESETGATDMGKILEDIKHVVQDIQDDLPQHSISCVIEKTHSIDQKPSPQEMEVTADSVISMIHESHVSTVTKHFTDQELTIAISQIREFVLLLGKESVEIHGRVADGQSLSQKLEDFSASANQVLSGQMTLVDFISALSAILFETCELRKRMLSDKRNEGECNISDCIDKVTLLENKVVQHDPCKEGFTSLLDSRSTSSQEVLPEGQPGPGYELKSSFDKHLLEEFEQLKVEKGKLIIDLAGCTEGWEQTKSQFLETEQLLAELKSQLTDCQKTNSLAETQLKCMAESYKTLESHAQELETEINHLRSKVENLENELQEEKHIHEDDLAKYKDLQEQIERQKQSSTCSVPSEVEDDLKTKKHFNLAMQEREIAAAAEKLAECQQTIFLLGRQLNSLRPQAELTGSPNREGRTTHLEEFLEEDPTSSVANPQGSHGMRQYDHDDMQMTGGESPIDGYNPLYCPSDTEAGIIPRSPMNSKRPKHRSSKSSSPGSQTPEKHARSFSRFFSRGKE
ncbi:Filament-like plant protein 4 [Acorus calamus]|uniref:Filament-like plant protein 4 n=1 Tax=Acorus calamus TaxID=4465 RepID=A0AAV9D9C2_ACOCL|nr:Filament-like plant protein 4 [Acorus calamus]